jgi:hypothetical protein
MTWPECSQVLRLAALGSENAKTFAVLHALIRKERRLSVSEFRELLEFGEQCGAVERDGLRYFLNDRPFLSSDLLEMLRTEFDGRSDDLGAMTAYVANHFPSAADPAGDFDEAAEQALKRKLARWNGPTLELCETEAGPDPGDALELGETPVP